MTDTPRDQTAIERRLERERRARHESERIAEQATRELYDTVMRLERSRGQLAEAASLVRVLQQVAVASNETDSFEEAAAIALDAVCDHTGWPVGHLYLVDQRGGLTPSNVWRVDDPARTEAFRLVTEQTSLASGEGLPGRVLASGRPAWIADVTRDPNFPRAAAADGIDVRAGFAIPVAVGGEVSAVLEFFSRQATEPDEELLAVLANVGGQLGRVIERSSFRRTLEHQSLHDALTGLPNRVLLLDRLQHALDRSRRDGATIALFFVDLDRFKAVNDSFGHHAGDELLIGVAERVPTVLRPGDSLVRLSGDEFVVLCEDVPDEAEALDLAARVLACVSAPFTVDGNEAHISASIGIALSSCGAATPEELLSHADMAMYRAKERGKGVIEVFDEALRTKVVTRLATERSLRRAIERDELVAHFQPVVDLRTGGIIGAESLVRWSHPTRGLLMPGEFIAMAEESGLIGRLGAWMVREACRQLQAPPASGGDRLPWMAVNLSVTELEQHDLVERIAATLDEHSIAPERLMFEITESAVMHDTQVVLRHLTQLREMGVRFAIDDFGTGFSSLDRIRSMPVQVLKIDCSFIRDMQTTPGATALVSAIIAMSHSLGLEVVAEGVELPEQLATLRRLGCDHAQGYLLGRPGPAASFVDAMSRSNLADVLQAAPVATRTDIYDELSSHISNALMQGDDVARTTRSLLAEIRRLVGRELLSVV